MTYRFPLYLSMIPVIIALGPLAVGAFFLLKKNKIGYLGLAISLFLLIFIGPLLLADRLLITETEIEHRTGLWFAPRIYGITFSETASIVIREEENRDGRLEEIWYFTDKQGKEEKVNPGDLWVFRKDVVIEACEKHGVKVSGMTSSY